MMRAPRLLSFLSKCVAGALVAASLDAYVANAADLSAKGLPKTIDIDIAQGGLARIEPQHYHITIDGGSARRGVDDIPLAAVTRLVEAINEPLMVQGNAKNAGMSAAWFADESKSALEKWYASWDSPRRLDANQERYFQAAFSSATVADYWMSGKARRFMVLDDYPFAGVTLTWTDGTFYKLFSRSIWPFMVPWETNPATVANYNADISRAVAGLLPQTALNRSRIAGDNLAYAYTDWLLKIYLRDELDSVRVRDLFGEQLAPIEKAYEITSMADQAMSSDDLNEITKNFMARPSVQLYLHDAADPPNVSAYMSLWSDGDKLTMVPEAVAAAKRDTAAVLSVPWLGKYLKENQQWSVQVRVVQDTSITPFLADSLIGDLRSNGKAGLADMLQPLLPQTVYLYLKGPNGAYSRWFVLPDRRMLLWNYKLEVPLPDRINNAPPWLWFGNTGVGVLFSPEGKAL